MASFIKKIGTFLKSRTPKAKRLAEEQDNNEPVDIDSDASLYSKW